MSYATAMFTRKNRLYILYFRNKQISTLVENFDSKMTRSFLKYLNSFTLFVSLFILALFSFAKFHNFFNIYKLNGEKNSNFRIFNEFDIL